VLFSNKFSRYADIVFVGVAFIGLCAFSISQFSVVNLGSPELCEKYTGLPSHWRDDVHAGMAHIHGGEFTLGTTLGYEEERSEVKTQVSDFWIDQTEVTVAQFADFVKATAYVTEAERDGGAVAFRKPNAEQLQQHSYPWWHFLKGANWRQPLGIGSTSVAHHPVTMVTLADAQAYAKWLGRDLPTEAEWEYAAKAGQQGANLEKEPRDAQGKPLANFWQGDFPLFNSREDGYEAVAPVGCYPANAVTLYDMVGNVWEQTKDDYTSSHEPHPLVSATASSALPNRAMVVKGGSHLCGQNFCVRYRPSAREAHEANLPIAHIGFRTVLRESNTAANPDFNPW
jgi:formylglycine-generating enzyme required for sulfatase activity